MTIMRIVVFLVICLLPFPSFASSDDYSEKLALIEAGTISQNQILQWEDHLLFPHLYEAWMSTNIESISTATANRFIDDNRSRAAAWFFRSKWHSELVRRKNWDEVIRTLADTTDPAMKCHYFEALQAKGKAIPASEIEQLWLSGSSRPDHCDPFFADWISHHANPDPLIWDRQLQAFYSRNGKLVRYLNRFYQTPESQRVGALLSKVYSDPKQLISQSYNPSLDRMHQVALAAVNRMAFQDPRSASNLWQAIVKATPSITVNEIRQASRYLGIAMAKQALPQASYWLTLADHDRNDEEVQHWRLQIALSDKDYGLVKTLYQELDATLQASDQWRYWVGVARLNTEGSLADDNPLIDLSKRRLYYGYLASGVLGTQPTLGTKNQYTPVDYSALANVPELQRAKALYEAGQTERAQVEWNLYIHVQDNPTQHAAAELALSWNWYAKASQSAGWSRRYDLLDLRYPLAFVEDVSHFTQSLNLPMHWVYGVMRQESRFEHTAVSPAGALGLMQVMPATARQTARKYDISYQGTSDLHDPRTNIAIGTHYMSELINRFDHPVLATAAYNAGPSRVITWRNRFPNDMTIWIESIPFNETRNYVKSVLAFSQIYALRNNEQWHLASWTNPATALAQNP